MRVFTWHAGELPGGGDWNLGLAFSCGSNWSIAGKSGEERAACSDAGQNGKKPKGRPRERGPLGCREGI